MKAERVGYGILLMFVDVFQKAKLKMSDPSERKDASSTEQSSKG